MRAFAVLIGGTCLTLACGGEVDIAKSPSSSGTGGQNAPNSVDGVSSSSGAGSSDTSWLCGAGASRATGDAAALGPSGATLAGRSVTLTFDAIPANFGPTYTESGFTVSQTTGNWVSVSTYGQMASSIEIMAAAGTTVTGEIQVTAGGVVFGFTSVELYSSTTEIPYTFVGLRDCTVVFTETNTQPGTGGTFQTIVGQHPTTPIDTLAIRLTDPAAPCCSNPTGLDNIVLTQ